MNLVSTNDPSWLWKKLEHSLPCQRQFLDVWCDSLRLADSKTFCGSVRLMGDCKLAPSCAKRKRLTEPGMEKWTLEGH